MRSLVVAVVLVAVLSGCGPKRALTRTEKLAGQWTGRPTDEKRASGEESFLSEQLGGYRLTLKGDGTFESDWRGLVRTGKWSIKGAELELQVERALGKTLAEARAENAREGTEVNDLGWFTSDSNLRVGDGDKTLTLPGQPPASQTVVFSRKSD